MGDGREFGSGDSELRGSSQSLASLVPDVPDSTVVGAGRAKVGSTAAGVTSQVSGVWMDLVRQAGRVVENASRPTRASGVSRQQLRALLRLPPGGLTMGTLARSLRISGASATSLADHLVGTGAAVRYRDTGDRRFVRLVVTSVGVQLASDYHAGQLKTLSRLLRQMEPARLSLITSAMEELTRAVSSKPGADPGKLLTPDARRWTLHSRDWS